MAKPTVYIPSITVVTKAMQDATAAMARDLVIDPTDYYPHAFDRWPMDAAVGSSLAIPCDPLATSHVAKPQESDIMPHPCDG